MVQNEVRSIGMVSIEPLSRSHRPLLKEFRNQHESLVEHIRRYALRHAEKDLLSRTYVAIDASSGTQRLAGYFSLTTASVDRESVTGMDSLARLPRYPIPAVLIAKLAVDERAQGQGIGRMLFREALGMTLRLVREGPVSVRLLVADAIDEQAVRFYAHFAMERISEIYPVRVVLDLASLPGSTTR
jgi:GNAT superfamily N-acetyltransferase